MAKTKPDWETIFRSAIERTGTSLIELAKQSGVHKSQLYRFMRKERGLSIKSAEQIAKQIGLELKPSRKSKKR